MNESQKEFDQPEQRPRALLVVPSGIEQIRLTTLCHAEGFDVAYGSEGWEKADSADVVLAVGLTLNNATVQAADRAKNNFGNDVELVLLAKSPEEAKKALSVGFDEAILTPFNEEDLAHRLRRTRRFIEVRRALDAERDGHHEDAERLKSMNESLAVASRRFEALFNGLPVACLTFDRDGLIQEWNSYSTKVFGVEGHEAFWNPLWDVLDPDSRGYWSYDHIQKIFESEEALSFDWCYVNKDQQEVYLACKILTLTNANGEKIAAVAGNLDITERVLAQRQIDAQVQQIQKYASQLEQNQKQLEAANRKLELLATTDSLTGVANRREFQRMLLECTERHARLGKPFSLLMFDIDHFKKLNDEFGHQAGDEILKIFARVLRKAARKHEHPARYGGEEFSIILENCGTADCHVAMERFKQAILAQKWPFRDITASIGGATYDGAEKGENLIERADQALYASKHSGRNCWTHHDALPKPQAA